MSCERRPSSDARRRGLTLLEAVAALALLAGVLAAVVTAGGRLHRRAFVESRRVAAVAAAERLLEAAERAGRTQAAAAGAPEPGVGRAVAWGLRSGGGAYADDPRLSWTARVRPLLAQPPRDPRDAPLAAVRMLDLRVADDASPAGFEVSLLVGTPRQAPEEKPGVTRG